MLTVKRKFYLESEITKQLRREIIRKHLTKKGTIHSLIATTSRKRPFRK